MRKGQALILVLVLINVFLIIVFVVSDLMLSELVIQRRMNNSMRAYYAAEAGIEKAILNIKNGDTSAKSDTVGDSSYQYDVTDLDPAEDAYEIKSTGKNLGTARKILIKIPKTVNPNDIIWPTRWKEINP